MSCPNRIYAFYGWVKDESGDRLVEETMAEHVDAALEAVDEMRWSIDGWRHLHPGFEAMLRVAVLLHDAGKAVHNIYLFKQGEDLRFPGHENISAWVVYDLFYESPDLRGRFGDMWRYILFAIANHHHPMGLFSRCQRFPKELLSEKLGDAISLFVEEIKRSRHVEEDRALQEVLGHLERIGQGVRDREIAEVYQSMCGRGNVFASMDLLWLHGDPRKRKTALTLTQALVLADYRAASKNRKGAVRKFVETVEKFFEINEVLGRESLGSHLLGRALV